MKIRIQEGVIHSPFPPPSLRSDTLYDFFRESANAYNLKPALVESQRTVSYTEFFESLKRCAGGLQQLGLGRGHRVYTSCCDTIDCFIAMCAIGCTGAAIVFSDPEADVLRKSGVTHILTDRVSASSLPINGRCQEMKGLLAIGDVAGYINIRRFMAMPELKFVATDSICGDDVLLVCFSSGTTGNPKAVELSVRSVLMQAAAQKLASFIEPDDRILVRCRMCHFFGFTKTFLAIHSGATTIIENNFRAISPAIATIRNFKVTRVIGASTGSGRLMESLVLDQETLPSLKAILCGSTAPGPNLLKNTVTACPSLVEFRNVYGMTEMCGPITTPPPGLISSPKGVGFPMPGTRIKIISTDTGAVLGPMVLGEVLVHSEMRMLGYTQKPAETAAVFTEDGWLRTGDLGFYDADGCLFLRDRLKMLIRCSDCMVYPSDLEEILNAHPDVSEAAVVGVPRLRSATGTQPNSETGEQIPAALVVAAKGCSPDQRFALLLKQYVAGEELRKAVRSQQKFLTCMSTAAQLRTNVTAVLQLQAFLIFCQSECETRVAGQNEAVQYTIRMNANATDV